MVLYALYIKWYIGELYRSVNDIDLANFMCCSWRVDGMQVGKGKVFGIRLCTNQVLKSNLAFESCIPYHWSCSEHYVCEVPMNSHVKKNSLFLCFFVRLVLYWHMLWSFVGHVIDNSTGDIATDQYHRYGVCLLWLLMNSREE